MENKDVIKNEIEFYRLPRHCSRDVSRLFTSINFGKEEEDHYFDQLPYPESDYHVHRSEYCTVGRFKFKPKHEIYENLDNLNELIYNS